MTAGDERLLCSFVWISRSLVRVPLTDAQWAQIEPLLPDRTPKRGGRWRDHREVIDAIAFKFQTGTQWVHLLEKYANWRGVYNRLRMWAKYLARAESRRVGMEIKAEVEALGRDNVAMIRIVREFAGFDAPQFIGGGGDISGYLSPLPLPAVQGPPDTPTPTPPGPTAHRDTEPTGTDHGRCRGRTRAPGTLPDILTPLQGEDVNCQRLTSQCSSPTRKRRCRPFSPGLPACRGR